MFEIALPYLLLFAPFVFVGSIIAIALAVENSPFILLVSTFLLIVSSRYTFHFEPPIAQTILAHLIWIIAFVIGYLVIGAIWVWPAFLNYISIQKEVYKTLYANYMAQESNLKKWDRSNGRDPVLVTKTQAEIDTDRTNHIKSIMGVNMLPLQVRLHKARIARWVIYWPFSMARVIIYDVVIHVGNFVYRLAGGTLQKIADNDFEKIKP